ncbi:MULTISPECIES: cell division protein FtsQ/DivIB [Megasphaera]|jgi:hypothetical protein|nr:MULTISPECIES: FtsQ-type POTRA domain-containing protein [Megasphaera]MUP48302.1 cell division protein FtsQ [Veillonellaceae bacterium M2-8]MUP59465.1 cell division protein FtsQ [Veillonellaceae bacterium M2-4]
MKYTDDNNRWMTESDTFNEFMTRGKYDSSFGHKKIETHTSVPRQGLSTRRIRKRKPLVKRKVWLVIAVFLIGWCLLRLAPIPFGTVEVHGNETMKQSDVYRAAGVGKPINVVQLSPNQMENRLHEDLRIGKVTVTRKFPFTIAIQLTERKPIALVMTMFGFAYIDDTGMIIQTASQIKGVSAPIITGKKVGAVLLGDTLDDATIQGVLQYIKILPVAVQEKITEVNMADTADIVVYTSDSIAIHLGKADHPRERADITMDLLRQVEQQQLHVQYIDTDIRAPLIKR